MEGNSNSARVFSLDALLMLTIKNKLNKKK